MEENTKNSGKSKRVSPSAGRLWNSSRGAPYGYPNGIQHPFRLALLIRIPEMTGLQKSLEASPLLHDRLNIIKNAPFLEVVPDGTTPLLVSGNMKPVFRLLPPNRKYFIRSLAVSPLTLNSRLIGSLNQGDSSPERYHPGMDTTLLMHLAQSVSDRLSHLLPSEAQSRHPEPAKR